MKRTIFFILIVTGIAVFSSAQTPGALAFHQEGIASWYGAEFDGKPTASGEIFNSSLFTAAHPSLPFGTILTITNKQNNQRVTVRVNDRGPFVSSRIIDLSKAAAEYLDMLSTGTAPVIVEQAVNTTLGPAGKADSSNVIIKGVDVNELASAGMNSETAREIPQITPPQVMPSPAQSPAVTAPPETTLSQPLNVPAVTPVPAPETIKSNRPAEIKGGIPAAGSTKLYRLQIGAYKIQRNAMDAFDKLKSIGLSPAYEKNGDFYRVVLAKIRAGDIPSVSQKLGNAGFPEALIREEN